jgi:hypothetical protein
MRKAIMALEGLEEVGTEEEINLSEIDEVSSEIEGTKEQISEASDIGETMGSIADVLDKSQPETPADVPAADTADVPSGDTAEASAADTAVAPSDTPVKATPEPIADDVSEETAEVVNIVTEHFCKRLGYKRKSMRVALENFGSSKKANVVLIKELRIAQEALDKQLTIAQEGLWARIKHRFSLMFTNEEKLHNNLKIVSGKFDSSGSKEGVLEKPGFSKYLNPKNKPSLTAKDIIDELSGLDKLINDDKLSSIIKNINTGMEKIVIANKKGTKGDYSIILKEQGKLADIGDILTKDYSLTKKGSEEADIEALTPSDKIKLVKILESILSNNKASKALDDIDDLYISFNEADEYLSKIEKQASATGDVLDDTWDALYKIHSVRQAWCHAAIAYIKASTK